MDFLKKNLKKGSEAGAVHIDRGAETAAHGGGAGNDVYGLW